MICFSFKNTFSAFWSKNTIAINNATYLDCKNVQKSKKCRHVFSSISDIYMESIIHTAKYAPEMVGKWWPGCLQNSQRRVNCDAHFTLLLKNNLNIIQYTTYLYGYKNPIVNYFCWYWIFAIKAKPRQFLPTDYRLISSINFFFLFLSLCYYLCLPRLSVF